jgi:hypothetical protein
VRAAALAAGLLLLLGCGGSKEEFIGLRSEDVCDQTWPVCERVVGCILGGQTFVSGRFPAQGQFLVRLAEPSTVTVGLYVEGVAGTGTDDAYIHWWEAGCSKRIRQSATALAFVTETERSGSFERSADLVEIGDHLIEFFADAQATYFTKVDVVPLRDQEL